jgi:hypothetical protein
MGREAMERADEPRAFRGVLDPLVNIISASMYLFFRRSNDSLIKFTLEGSALFSFLRIFSNSGMAVQTLRSERIISFCL